MAAEGGAPPVEAEQGHGLRGLAVAFQETLVSVVGERMNSRLTFHEGGIMRTLAMLATLLVGLGYVVTTPAYAAPKLKVAQDLQCPSPCVSAAEVEADVATQAELDALQAALNTLQANLDALVDADTLADLPSCMDGDVARFDGDVWNCESGAPLVVVDSTGAVVGQVHGRASINSVEILIRLDDGRLVTGLRVAAHEPNKMPFGEELRSKSLGCLGPFFVETGLTAAIFLPFATVGPDDWLYIADDLSGAGPVTTLSSWNSKLELCTDLEQTGPTSVQFDPVMQLNFVPPFHIE